MTGAIVVGGVLLVGVVGLVAWRAIRTRRDPWEREFVAEDLWRLVNRAGVDALDVYSKVEGGRSRGIGTGEIGDLKAGEVRRLHDVFVSMSAGRPA